MSEEPTLGEIMRRLDSTVKSMAELAAQMRADRETAATTYVRRDWLDEARKADRALVHDVSKDLAGLEDERLRNANFRKQVGLGAALGVLPIMGAFGLAIYNTLTGSVL